MTTRRAVPLLALWLDRGPDEVSAARPSPRRPSLLVATSPAATRNFSLSFPTPAAASDRNGWREIARNRSWVVYARD